MGMGMVPLLLPPLLLLVNLVPTLGAAAPASDVLVWPQPAHVDASGASDVALSASFAFAPLTPPGAAEAMALLSAASQRYAARIHESDPQARSRGGLDELKVQVSSVNATLTQGVDESYELSVSAVEATLRAQTVFGALRGMESFAQLVNTSTHSVPAVSINDAPRFPYRGILVDTARHYLNVSRLEQIVDSMEMHKLNVLQV